LCAKINVRPNEQQRHDLIPALYIGYYFGMYRVNGKQYRSIKATNGITLKTTLLRKIKSATTPKHTMQHSKNMPQHAFMNKPLFIR